MGVVVTTAHTGHAWSIEYLKLGAQNSSPNGSITPAYTTWVVRLLGLSYHVKHIGLLRQVVLVISTRTHDQVLRQS